MSNSKNRLVLFHDGPQVLTKEEQAFIFGLSPKCVELAKALGIDPCSIRTEVRFKDTGHKQGFHLLRH